MATRTQTLDRRLTTDDCPASCLPLRLSLVLWPARRGWQQSHDDWEENDA